MKLSQLKHKVKLKTNYCSAGGTPSTSYPINTIIEITIGEIDNRNNWFRAVYIRDKFHIATWWFAPEDFIWLNKERKNISWL